MAIEAIDLDWRLTPEYPKPGRISGEISPVLLCKNAYIVESQWVPKNKSLFRTKKELDSDASGHWAGLDGLVYTGLDKILFWAPHPTFCLNAENLIEASLEISSKNNLKRFNEVILISTDRWCQAEYLEKHNSWLTSEKDLIPHKANMAALLVRWPRPELPKFNVVKSNNAVWA